MSKKAVIFDIVDVLVCYTGEDPMNKWDDLLGFQKGGIFSSLEKSGLATDASTGKFTEQELWRRIGQHLGLNEQMMYQFVHDLWSGGKLNEGLAKFLNDLHPFYKTATLSNDWPGARQQNNRRYSLDKTLIVDVMIYSSEEGMEKPEPRFFHLACHRLGVQPEEVIFLDDKEENVEASISVGMSGIVFKSTEQAIADIQKCLEAYRIE